MVTQIDEQIVKSLMDTYKDTELVEKHLSIEKEKKIGTEQAKCFSDDKEKENIPPWKRRSIHNTQKFSRPYKMTAFKL